MVSSSDRNLIAEARRATGATNSAQFSTIDLEKDLIRSKQEISKEIREKLNNGQTLNFEEGASQKALSNYFKLLIAQRKQTKKAGKGRDKPDRGRSDEVLNSISVIRRTDFRDPDMNYWRDELARGLKKI